MLQEVLLKVFGSRNQRFLRSIAPLIASINEAESVVQAYSDQALGAATATLKSRLSAGETLEALLPEAFALVREASVRTLGLRHFDAQLIGGIVLHRGKITEMGTGEGKTLVATLAAYLNALSGQGVHVVTVNDYLAQRDEAWMRPIYQMLGITTGAVVSNMTFEARKMAYAADVTYGTNNEFGFDYLRDHMAHDPAQQVQRSHAFAIVDEVDSILIDDARTPLIISGEIQEDLSRYAVMNELAVSLKIDQDFSLDEKERLVILTEAGHQHVEAWLDEQGLLNDKGLYDVENIGLLHMLNAVLRGQYCFKKDVDYIVQSDQIVLIDEHTGRATPGRRWSDGLHQAVEVKEGVTIQQENRTLASITLQNYFRLYDKLSGMTGTADTEAYEFQHIYGLEVVQVPTHKPTIRKDESDRLFLNTAGKNRAIIREIKARHQTSQPVLVGTASIQNSEILSELLKSEGISHAVLNAKHHENEAQIIAQAGCLGAVTIATNMAGRGTDIVLGGAMPASDQSDSEAMIEWRANHERVKALGGLHVLGTERHESRRIDDQLRGRAGRQGDPGSTQFYVALEDPLMRIFAGEKVIAFMGKMMEEDETLEQPILTRQIAGAQRKVEGFNFDIRKQLLRFDDVANEQRQLVYHQRQTVLEAHSIQSSIENTIPVVMQAVVDEYIPAESLIDAWDLEGLVALLKASFLLECDVDEWRAHDDLTVESVQSRVLSLAQARYRQQCDQLGAEVIHPLEKSLMLEVLDQQWYEHLTAMDQLREGIHLRSYAQKNPTEEYKRESFQLFKAMLLNIKREVISVLFRVELSEQALTDENKSTPHISSAYAYSETSAIHESASVMSWAEELPINRHVSETAPKPLNKVGRNEPCPCGSGQKYKRCHGRLE
ncbi:MAG: preprotein translocase subunit SecA [Legionellales bacterium]|nr:preprotein translocase subunit SecA [Legionellales bacterium]